MKLVLALVLLSFSSAVAAQEEDAEHRADRLRTQQLNHAAAAAIARRDGSRRVDDRPNHHAQAYDDRYDQDMRRYRAARAQYERDMAEWRDRVSACRAGYYDACDDR